MRIGKFGSETAEGGLERGESGSESGESVIGVVERGELKEEFVVAGEDFGTELILEEADGVVEFFSGGGGGTGGESGGGEGSGGE